MCTSPDGRRDRPGDDAQQGRLAGAGAAEQADDLAGVDGQIDVVEHQQILAAVLVETTRQTLRMSSRLVGGCVIEHDVFS